MERRVDAVRGERREVSSAQAGPAESSSPGGCVSATPFSRPAQPSPMGTGRQAQAGHLLRVQTLCREHRAETGLHPRGALRARRASLRMLRAHWRRRAGRVSAASPRGRGVVRPDARRVREIDVFGCPSHRLLWRTPSPLSPATLGAEPRAGADAAQRRERCGVRVLHLLHLGK